MNKSRGCNVAHKNIIGSENHILLLTNTLFNFYNIYKSEKGQIDKKDKSANR